MEERSESKARERASERERGRVAGAELDRPQEGAGGLVHTTPRAAPAAERA